MLKRTYIQDEAEADMRSLKLELKHTLEIYTTACRETLAAQQKVKIDATKCYCY